MSSIACPHDHPSISGAPLDHPPACDNLAPPGRAPDLDLASAAPGSVRAKRPADGAGLR
ncbi:hypothetical protein [Nannocystis pusilla]|uniref:hypothetical protein n=1 Tax=Nannocystis pusilla TaxID=889268 RepID=UPI001CC98295|nr:hypothetical protein [Nannocystis pusilla]